MGTQCKHHRCCRCCCSCSSSDSSLITRNVLLLCYKTSTAPCCRLIYVIDCRSRARWLSTHWRRRAQDYLSSRRRRRRLTISTVQFDLIIECVCAIFTCWTANTTCVSLPCRCMFRRSVCPIRKEKEEVKITNHTNWWWLYICASTNCFAARLSLFPMLAVNAV